MQRVQTHGDQRVLGDGIGRTFHMHYIFALEGLSIGPPLPSKHQDSLDKPFHTFPLLNMHLSTILITAFVAAVSQAAPIQDSSSPTTHLSRDKIQHFLQARDQFMFDRKEDYPDVPLRDQTRFTRRDGDCSSYPAELQLSCESFYGGDDEDYSNAPLDADEIIGTDNFDSSQIGWNARRS